MHNWHVDNVERIGFRELINNIRETNWDDEERKSGGNGKKKKRKEKKRNKSDNIWGVDFSR